MLLRRSAGLLTVLATAVATIGAGVQPADATATTVGGRFDSAVTVYYNQLAVRGWVVDRSAPTESTTAAVYVDSKGYSLAANQPRPDVARALHLPSDAGP